MKLTQVLPLTALGLAICGGAAADHVGKGHYGTAGVLHADPHSVAIVEVPDAEVTIVVPAHRVEPGQLSPHTRILPRHVYEERVLTQGVRIPRGYEPAFDDGRLNPRRAEQSLAGQQQMQLIWTDTVPRRLVKVVVAER